MRYVLQQDNWWIADWEGDPPRTLKIENAKVYNSLQSAKIARGYYNKRYAHIRKMDLQVKDF